MRCDRYWFLTWHTYGTWLPGDERGFVSAVCDEDGNAVIHNSPGTPIDADSRHLSEWAKTQLKCPPLTLDKSQARLLAQQFHETASVRGWKLFAFSIVTTHVHVVIGVPGDPDPEKLLGDLKSYGSRVLNRNYGRPASETWWVESGSKRKLPNDLATLGAVRYTLDQGASLVVWTAAIPELHLAEGYRKW